MRTSAPVMLAARSPARKATASATSPGCEKRPVTDWWAASSATSSARAPVARATVSATPPAPSHSAVATGPGLTVLTRTPRGPTSFDRALQKLASAALARAVVDHAGVGQDGVDGADRDDRSPTGGQHQREDGPRRAHRRQQVQLQRRLPLVVGDLEEPTWAGGADPTLFTRTSTRSPASATRRAGPAGSARVDGPPPAPIPRRRARRARGRRPGARDDVGALRHQRLHHRQPDAPAGARDHRHPTLQPEVHRPLPSVEGRRARDPGHPRVHASSPRTGRSSARPRRAERAGRRGWEAAAHAQCGPDRSWR